MSNSFRPHGRYPARHFCPSDFLGKNTGGGCHFLLQSIFLTQGSNLCLLHCQVDSWPVSHEGSSRSLIFKDQRGDGLCHLMVWLSPSTASLLLSLFPQRGSCYVLESHLVWLLYFFFRESNPVLIVENIAFNFLRNQDIFFPSFCDAASGGWGRKAGSRLAQLFHIFSPTLLSYSLIHRFWLVSWLHSYPTWGAFLVAQW